MRLDNSTPASSAPLPAARPSQFRIAAALRWGVLLLLAFETFTHGVVPAFQQTFKLITQWNISANAPEKQKGESDQLVAQARTQLAVANASAERMKGEALRAEADADRLEQEAITAAEVARNAALKARSDAENLDAVRQLRTEKVTTAIEQARNAIRLFAADAIKAETQARLLHQQNQILRQTLPTFDCSRARPGDFIQSRFLCRPI